MAFAERDLAQVHAWFNTMTLGFSADILCLYLFQYRRKLTKLQRVKK